MRETTTLDTLTSGEKTRKLAANALSLGRAAFMAFRLLQRQPPTPLESAAIYISDKADGLLARGTPAQRSVATPRSARLDELMDKATTTLHGLSNIRSRNQSYPAWVLPVSIARDIAITDLRNRAQREGKDVKARPWGKLKTAVQSTALSLGETDSAKEPGTIANRTIRGLHVASVAIGMAAYIDGLRSYGQPVISRAATTLDTQPNEDTLATHPSSGQTQNEETLSDMR